LRLAGRETCLPKEATLMEPVKPVEPIEPFETLDPANQDDLRRLAHRMVDDAFDDLRSLRERPVWRPMPDDVRAAFRSPVPREGTGAEAAYAQYRSTVAPYLMGNDHPRFWGWYMGNGTMMGALGAFLAAAANPNLGGGNHSAIEVEKQVVRWCAELLGLPLDAGGIMVSGASMANLVGWTVARHVHAGVDVRADGVVALPQPLVAYSSVEVHSCHARSAELLGLGSQALRLVPTDTEYRIDLAALRRAIAEDRAAGKKPFLVVGNAGTINTGAMDDLVALADLCAEEKLWFHVDGAIGALVGLAPALAPLVRGIERADSVALDLHKWMHVPFEAGMALVRDAEAHRATFATTPAYLAQAPRGLAGGATWLSNFGVQLSRDFKALKVWLSWMERGVDAYGRMMQRNVDQARSLVERIEREPMFELLAPVVLDIVCFRVRPEGWSEDQVDALNRELLMRMHESGVAVPSYSTLQGRYCLRVAIGNHRARQEDFDVFVDTLLKMAGELVSEVAA
jgi:aromatic-L-amino-acid/L-tryptophan decarboxylase